MSASFWPGKNLGKASIEQGQGGEQDRSASNSPRRRKRGTRTNGSRLFKQLGFRRLGFDPLEERALLSVTPGALSAILVNQTFGSVQETNTAHSTSVDNSGDFVVAWSRQDPITNPSATVISFTATGLAVQPITGTFQLKVGGTTTGNIAFDSTSTASLNLTATHIQAALSAAGQPFATVTYNPNAANPASTIYNFTINYGSGTTAPSISYIANVALPLPIYFGSAVAPIIDPSTGAPFTQSNVYARYFTNEVQQLTIPTSATTNFDNSPNTVGHFSLKYNAQTVMELAVTAGTAPTNDPFAPLSANVFGTFTLAFDANGNGVVDPGETLVVNFDETNTAAAATLIQSWLQSYTPVNGISNTKSVTVNAVDPQHIMIDFGAATQGLDQSALLKYVIGSGSFTGGYLPAVVLTTLDRPFAINNIPVSQTDPNQTAQAIQSWFQQQAGAYSTGVAPFSFPATDRITPNNDGEAPYTAPIFSNVGSSPGATAANVPQTGFNPSVSVVPVNNPDGSVSLTEFDITFTGQSGYQIEPQLLVTAISNENNTAIPTSQASALILKETSPEFRVNSTLPNTSAFSLTPVIYNSDQPSVAMDASGDFAITWRQEVSQQLAPKDGTDIFMRMYTPVGITNSFNPGTYVPGQTNVTSQSDTAGQIVTGVRLIASPTVSQQQLITFTATGSVPISGTFKLTIASNTNGQPITTAAISFDSSNPTATATNIEVALINAGFRGVTVAYTPPAVQPLVQKAYSFTVTFGGLSQGIDEAPIQLAAGSTVPATFAQSTLTADMYTQVVNAAVTTNPQYDPAIAMDPEGNIVVVWASQGQDVSYFNDIYMQRFDRFGNTIGGATLVNIEDTDIETQPAVVMGADDNVVVSWTEYTNPAYIVSGLGFGTVFVRAFSPSSQPLWTQQAVTAAGSSSSIAIDGEDNFLVSWTANADTDLTGKASLGIYAEEFALSGGVQTLTFTSKPFGGFSGAGIVRLQIGNAITAPIVFNGASAANDASNIQTALVAAGYNCSVTYTTATNGAISTLVFTISFRPTPSGGSVPPIRVAANTTSFAATVAVISTGNNGPVNLRPTFRMNSASTTVSPVSIWPLDQTSSAVAMDLDGDIAGVFQGDGPQVANDINIPASFFTQFYVDPSTGLSMNQDLLTYFDPFPHNGFTGDTLPGNSSSTILYGVSGTPNGDNSTVQTAIDQVLFNAEYVDTPAATQEQLGRLRNILESVAGLLRGESAGILLSQFDASAAAGVATGPTYSDSIVSTQRSGEDQRYYIIINPDAEQGSFTLQLSLNSDSQPDNIISTPVTVNVTVPVPGLGQFAGIDANATQTNIWTAITGALGNVYPGFPTDGQSLDVRQVPLSEIDARDLTEWQLPDPTYPATYDGAAANQHPSQNYLQPPSHGYTVYELTFQGDMHDIPITMGVTQSAMQFWTPQPGQQGAVTPVLVGASAPETPIGDYAGTQGAQQYNTSIGMTSEGDMLVSYTSQSLQTDGTVPIDAAGNSTYQNIYVEPLNESTNTAGPQLVGWADPDGADLLNGSRQGGTVTNVAGKYFVLTFDQAMMAGNPLTNANSVLDLANYKLYNANGVSITGGISQAQYGLSEVAQLAHANPSAGFSPIPSNKWEVVLKIGGSGLPSGAYTLQIDHAQPSTSTSTGQSGLENIFGTPLNLSGFNPQGFDFLGSVTISNSSSVAGNPGTPGTNTVDTPINSLQNGRQTDPSVAAAADGSYVVVWTAATNGPTEIVAQRFKANGKTLGPEFVVNTYASGTEAHPAVAMDAAGDFVVAWDGEGPDFNAITNTLDVFARIYSSNGQAIGGQFQVDYYEAGAQSQPRVAMTSNGNFVVTFTSYVQTVINGQASGGSSLIFAREFNIGGSALINALQPAGYEFQVSSTQNSGNQQFSDVAADPAGDFVVTWEGDFQNSSNWGVYAKYYYANGTVTGEVRLDNTINTRSSFVGDTSIHPTGPRVGMDSLGNFVATWASFTNTSSGYDIYARRFSKGIVARDANEFLVNQTTANWQVMPAIGVAANGDFTIAWASYLPEPLYSTVFTYDVEARMYNADGSDFFDTATNVAPMEYRVNATVPGAQVAPAVNRGDLEGDSDMVWVGPAPSAPAQTAIFARVVDPPPKKSTSTGTSKPVTTTTSTGSSTPPPSTTTTTTTTTKPVTTTTKPVTTTTTTTKAPGGTTTVTTLPTGGTTKPPTTTTTTTTTKPVTTTTTTTKPVTTTTTTTTKPVTSTTTATTSAKPVTSTSTSSTTTSKPVTTTSTSSSSTKSTTTTATTPTAATGSTLGSTIPSSPPATGGPIRLNAKAVNQVLRL